MIPPAADPGEAPGLPEEMRTARLRLRPPRFEDSSEMARLLGDPEVARWLARVPDPYRVDDARAFVEHAAEMRRTGAGWPYSILAGEDAEPPTGTLLGGIALRLDPGEPNWATVGFWLGRTYWGQGFATEALRALLAAAFAALPIEGVYATSLSGNDASQRVQAKAGMILAGLREFGFRDGFAKGPRFEIRRDAFAADGAGR